MTSINSELIIDPKIFRENISLLKNKLNNSSKFMAVIKSDAYGHHLEHIVKDIEDLSDGFGVVRIDEALKIRELSNKKILLMQGVYSKEDLDISIQNKFDLVVHNQDQFQILKEGNHYEGLWLKLNTGMNRQGNRYPLNETREAIKKVLDHDVETRKEEWTNPVQPCQLGTIFLHKVL